MTQKDICIMVEAYNEAWRDLQRSEYYAAKNYLEFGCGYTLETWDIIGRDMWVMMHRAKFDKCRDLCDRFDIKVNAFNFSDNVILTDANQYNVNKHKWIIGRE